MNYDFKDYPAAQLSVFRNLFGMLPCFIALYFSRESIPSLWKGWKNIPRYMQTGVIAFRRNTLFEFNAMKETQLEQIESIDMNRVLETGSKIRMLLTESTTIGVDVPEELDKVEKMLVGDVVMESYHLYLQFSL